MNKKIKDKYGVTIKTPKAQIVNDAGGAAFVRPSKENVLKMLLVGSSANTYYVSGDINIDRAVTAFQDESVDTSFLAKAIIYARDEGFNRELPILALAVLSVRDVEKFKHICNRVLKNPHDWEMFIDICKSGKVRTGVGRAIKTEMVKALRTMPQYQTLKYPSAVFDMVNISRPNPNEVPSAYYVKNGGKWKEFVSTLDNRDVLMEKMGLFLAYDTAKNLANGASQMSKAAQDDVYDGIANSIVTNRLPYEVMTSVIGKNEKCWNALYESAPYFNMVRNLNNFIKYGAINSKNAYEAAGKIGNVQAIQKSKMYPFRFYQAWKNLTNTNGGNLSDAGLGVIRYALEGAIETSLQNVPELPGVTCVATDVSGSMSSPVNSDNTDISCVEVAGIFSAILKMKNKNNIMLPFESDVVMDYVHRINAGKSVMEIANVYHPRGGTALAAPLAYLINHRVKIDTFIGITDNMEWIPANFNASRYTPKLTNGMFIDAFLYYKKMVNPKMKAYLITLMPYEGAPAPVEVEDVTMIYGWSDQVFKFIGKDFNAQVNTVENISLD